MVLGPTELTASPRGKAKLLSPDLQARLPQMLDVTLNGPIVEPGDHHRLVVNRDYRTNPVGGDELAAADASFHRLRGKKRLDSASTSRNDHIVGNEPPDSSSGAAAVNKAVSVPAEEE